MTAAYPDEIDLTGEVRATDLDGLRFTLRLADGRTITGNFKPEQEKAVLEALGEHVRRRLRVRGLGNLAPKGGRLEQIVDVRQVEVVGAEAASQEGAPVWERLAAIGAAVPNRLWLDVPASLSERVDQYLYGRRDSN